MIRIVLLSLLVCPFVAVAEIGEEEVLAIAAKPHDEVELIEPLRIYPAGREFDVKMVIQKGGIDDIEVEFVSKLKTVEGKYLVVSAVLPGTDRSTEMVITFDEKANVYRKLLAGPFGFAVMEGVSPRDSRAIAWRTTRAAEGAGFEMVYAIEQYSDTEGTWVEVFAEDGEESYRIVGESKVREK